MTVAPNEFDNSDELFKELDFEPSIGNLNDDDEAIAHIQTSIEELLGARQLGKLVNWQLVLEISPSKGGFAPMYLGNGSIAARTKLAEVCAVYMDYLTKLAYLPDLDDDDDD